MFKNNTVRDLKRKVFVLSCFSNVHRVNRSFSFEGRRKKQTKREEEEKKRTAIFIYVL